MADPLHVTVVSGEGVIWEGEAVSIVVRTTEGDIGILSNHEPVLAVLVPCAAELVTPDGRREVVAIEGGFISVFQNRVSLLSDSASMPYEYSLADARAELAHLKDVVDSGTADADQLKHYNRLLAQVRAGEKYAELKR